MAHYHLMNRTIFFNTFDEDSLQIQIIKMKMYNIDRNLELLSPIHKLIGQAMIWTLLDKTSRVQYLSTQEKTNK